MLSFTVDNVPTEAYAKLSKFMHSEENQVEGVIFHEDPFYSNITKIEKGVEDAIDVSLTIKDVVHISYTESYKTPRRITQKIFDILDIFPEE